MTGQSSPQPSESHDTTMYPPAGEGRLEITDGSGGDYRERLRSRRWDAAPLENPEAQKTDPRIAVAAIVILSAVTLIVLVVGYSAGLWTLG